eukprot:TRINITY_DN62915_c0_g1_i1.p1 TRINITY_DN62915_c0_g1~~TRINITY_DN62915_c0_g1_i1.p1  ORF type:complete len:269 (-),score=13.07 TRINITY_DN62915_c0_g1_i1:169-858(-)
MAGSPVRSPGSSPTMHCMSHVKGSPKWSFRQRHPGVRGADTPGPGSYNHGDLHPEHKKSPQFSFGAAPRDTHRAPSHPGPGQYSPVNLSHRNSEQFSLGKAQRKSVPNRADQPGPGQYQTPQHMGSEGPKFTAIGKRSQNNTQQNTPGPGSYSSSTSLDGRAKVAPAWGFGTAPRGTRNGMSNPGPGAYNPPPRKTNGPSYSMRSRSEFKGPVSTPGPGEYATVHSQFG